jgi:hypothetical protein
VISTKANKLFRKYRTLKQFRKVSDSDLMKLSEEKAMEYDYDISSKFATPKDRKEARSLLEQYLKQYDIETIADKEYLSDLIYLKILQRRIREQMEKYTTENDNAVPANLLDTLNQLSESVTKVTNNLGLNKREDSALNILESLKQRFKKHRLENQATRTLSCAHCGKMLLLKIRTAAWTAAKHPFFQDKILSNKALIKLYLQNKLSKAEVAEVLECSPDYIDWLIEKVWKTNPFYQEFFKSLSDASTKFSKPLEETQQNNEACLDSSESSNKTDNEKS